MPRVLNKAGFQVRFTADTPLVPAAGGTIRAADPRPGVVQLSRDEYDPEGVVGGKVVGEVLERWGAVWEVTVRGRPVETTHEHPFRRRGDGWVPAHERRPGDVVRRRDGRAAVEAVRHQAVGAEVFRGAYLVEKVTR